MTLVILEKNLKKMITKPLNVTMQQRRENIDCCFVTIFLNPIFVNTYQIKNRTFRYLLFVKVFDNEMVFSVETRRRLE